MLEQGDDLEQGISNTAMRAVQRYARGLLSVEVLTERMMQEWRALRFGDENPSQGLLVRIAQRICSRELYAAWRSPEQEYRDLAFANLKCYLENSLRQLSFAESLRLYPFEMEDVLQQTLSDLLLALKRTPPTGPSDPAAFLKYAQTISIRNACAYLKKARNEPRQSLEAQPEILIEQIVDRRNEDPQEQVLQRELQQILKNAILSLRNPHYRQVLICIYLAGMDESELACHLQVQVQDVYLWRHRAIKALRSRPEVMQALRPWLR